MKINISLSYSSGLTLRSLLRKYKAFVLDNGSKYLKMGIEFVPSNLISELEFRHYNKKTTSDRELKYVADDGSYVVITSGNHVIVTAYIKK